jgi:hypothetical protein
MVLLPLLVLAWAKAAVAAMDALTSAVIARRRRRKVMDFSP